MPPIRSSGFLYLPATKVKGFGSCFQNKYCMIIRSPFLISSYVAHRHKAPSAPLPAPVGAGSGGGPGTPGIPGTGGAPGVGSALAGFRGKVGIGYSYSGYI